ncbi:MAG: M1 family aminopeptidase [Rhodothermales bacterium]
MPRFLFAAVIAISFAVAGCSSTQEVYEITEVDRPAEYASDSLTFEAQRARVDYIQPARVTPDVAPDRDYDLLTTALDVSFDFADEAVVGTARHTLSPLRNGLARFYFHAEAMEIQSVRQVVDGEDVGVGFEYDSTRLTIVPREPLALDSAYTFVVDYVAHPTRGAGQGSLGDGGKGLYFIDPMGTDPYRPTQIWTQGQAESNRRWFPTWDYPNDRMAFEITMTVPDSLVTASNGALVEQTPMPNGLRRDRWALSGDQPAYLAAVAAGAFAVVRDSVVSTDGRTIPVEYFVEPAFAEAAGRIFGETPAMIRYFEEKIGVPYPWQNYKQMPVRDFTAGGMENTTITKLYEWIQTDERAYLDVTGRDLIVHELAHQWFGDLLTAEDWANLALNESFASYLEEVYIEDTEGRADAQAHGIEDRLAYFEQAETLRRPIVWYGYDTPTAMFDRHTYQKGGQVLNQLRFELGDEAFWRGINRYVEQNRYRTVELDDLRQAFEEVTGRSLRRFFDQWFREPGHPVLDVEQAYFAGSTLYTVQVVQRQDLKESPVFAFDVNVELNYPTRPTEVRRVRIAAADTTLRFKVPEKPSFVRFNEGNWAFVEATIEQPLSETLVQAVSDDEMAGRYAAIVSLSKQELNPQVRAALVQTATEDEHAFVRERAAEALERYAQIAEVRSVLAGLAQRDDAPSVRRAALTSIAGPSAQAKPVLQAALADPSYLTQATAVRLFAEHFRSEAFDAFRPLFDLASWRGTVEEALIETITKYRLGEMEGVGVLTAKTGVMNPDNVRLAAINGLLVWARRDEDVRPVAASALARLVGDERPGVRQAVASALAEIGDEASIAALEAQVEVERDPVVEAALRGAVEQIKKGSTQVRAGE